MFSMYNTGSNFKTKIKPEITSLNLRIPVPVRYRTRYFFKLKKKRLPVTKEHFVYVLISMNSKAFPEFANP
jgi:hypothetical protein